MKKILVPVDGSRHAINAVKLAISMVNECLVPEIHILNVQPGLLTFGVLPIIDVDAFMEMQQDDAKKAIKSATHLLNKANIKYTPHIETGSASLVIVNYAKSNNCDWIIMGTRGMGSFGNWVLGSTANQVIHLAKVPVTLVK